MSTLRQFSNEEITKARGVSLHRLLGIREGREVSIRCPFHNERTPSCRIYPDNSWHCFGCGSHGSGAIDFVIGMGATFTEAVTELLNENN